MHFRNLVELYDYGTPDLGISDLVNTASLNFFTLVKKGINFVLGNNHILAPIFKYFLQKLYMMSGVSSQVASSKNPMQEGWNNAT